MRKRAVLIESVMFAPLALMLAACSIPGGAVAPALSSLPLPAVTSVETLADPFAYCAAVGTIGSPDARYTGPNIPDAIINGFKKAAGLESSTEPMDMLRQTTIWRCMDRKVYACNFGANLPCDSKANTDKTPSAGMADYCKSNPDSEVVPMSVTGHDTIYSWRCVQDTPQVLDQISQVDAAGYLSQIWYLIGPGQ
jgi:hypothetical protein